MENKTKKSYIDVFAYIKEHFPTLANFNKVTTDFELGLRNALRQIYKEVEVMGCYFHFTQVQLLLRLH